MSSEKIATPDHPTNHNTFVLSIAQAFGGSIGAIAISLGALSGAYLLAQDKQALATLPVAMYAVGTASFALPVSLLCKNYGRRLGFIIGALLGIAGAVLACFALLQLHFHLFCVAFLIIGGSSAFVQQYRFAAADQGSDAFKSRAISWVLTGGVLAAIIGPQIALRTKNLLLPTPFAGAFIGMGALLIIAIIILMFLRPISVETPKSEEYIIPPRPLGEIFKQPIFFIALLCAISSYGLMTFMMTGAPLAMTQHGHSHQQAIIGIQWHVMAMFAPSFITGKLIVKFGKIPVIASGLSLLLICSGIAISGVELWNFWTSLILLGVGWNFAFIGATALLGESYTAAEKNKVQGAHDTLLFSCVASAAFLSGSTLNAIGWQGVALVIIPIASLSLLSLFWLHIVQRTAKTVKS